MSTQQAHIGELVLRRHLAGELPGEEATRVRAHADDCVHCRARLRAFEDEQRAFEQEIPFERFAAGVTRALRRPGQRAAQPVPRGRWLYPVMAMAAMLALVLGGGPLQDYLTRGPNRTKGGAAMAVKVTMAATGHQRTVLADVPEPLAPGEVVSVGYKSDGYRYVLVVSLDEQGVLTPLYPADGRSIPVEGAKDQYEYLPVAVEFTGRGAEQLFVLLSNEPLEADRVREAAVRALKAAGGDLSRIESLELPGVQLGQTFLKP